MPVTNKSLYAEETFIIDEIPFLREKTGNGVFPGRDYLSALFCDL
jgi:hypothetical protein